jgi:hypothetical protein
MLLLLLTPLLPLQLVLMLLSLLQLFPLLALRNITLGGGGQPADRARLPETLRLQEVCAGSTTSVHKGSPCWSVTTPAVLKLLSISRDKTKASSSCYAQHSRHTCSP